MPWRVEQITTRFLAIVVSVAAAIAVLVAGAVAWWQFEAQRARLDAYMADIARLTAIALVEPLWTINDSTTRATVGWLSVHAEIACAEVLDSGGRLIAATRDRGCGTLAGDARRLVQPVSYGEQRLGELVLWVDRGAIADAARKDVRLTVLVFLLLTAAMVVTAVFALRATVMEPLERLVEAIRLAGKVAVNRRPKDELGRVITAYNGLLDRVDAHTAEVEEARAQAVAAAQAKSRFLATMSHEIRTPMHGVLGTVELLRETPLSREQRGYADVILHSTQSLLEIINDILDLSKIEAGQVRIAPIPASPLGIVQDVLGALAATAQAKGVRLEIDCAPDTPDWVMADPLRLRQVVMNLVGNAVKFTEQGAVSVAIGLDGERLAIAVTDTGMGIAPDTLPRLFEPFYQGDDSTTRRHGGTGLGLSISRQLVERMGGTIEVKSTQGQGSTFRVLLPLAEAAPPPRPAHAAMVAPAGGGRVLAAEDNPINQWLLRAQLIRLGYEPDIHSDGRSALAAFSSGSYRAVVTDYHMPLMDGLHLARAIRAAEQATGRPRTPIIGLTADAFAETVDECLNAGMDDVVTKPLSLERLGAVLAGLSSSAAAANRAATPAPDVLADEAPLLDQAVVLAAMGGDATTRGEMTALFHGTVDDLLRSIRTLKAQADARGLMEAAHSLASAALSIGAIRLGMAARALEHAAKTGNWAEARGLVDAVAALDEQTRAALDQVG